MPNKERPIVERRAPDSGTFKMGPAIISPCAGCKNNTPVHWEQDAINKNEFKNRWPCPKQILYAKNKASDGEVANRDNFGHPVYDQALKSINPVWPGLKDYNNQYGYLFLAFIEDNVNNGWNSEWDTAKIRCRGPFLLGSKEKAWNYLGRAEQRDPVIGFISYYHLDGVEFKGYAFEAAVRQGAAKGYTRKEDADLRRILSGYNRNQ